LDLQQKAIDAVQARFPEAFRGVGEFAGQKWVVVDRENVVPTLKMLRDEQGYEFLMDLTCVDWLGFDPVQPERFSIVYLLYSLKNNVYFRIRAWVPETDPRIPSVHALYKAAPWAEREVWDMYGITFDDHPDLRRLLMPYDYEGHPLRKDYPLQGRGERQNFARYVK
jgi:NADH-quinone oxidoreductase subunit C